MTNINQFNPCTSGVNNCRLSGYRSVEVIFGVGPLWKERHENCRPKRFCWCFFLCPQHQKLDPLLLRMESTLALWIATILTNWFTIVQTLALVWIVRFVLRRVKEQSNIPNFSVEGKVTLVLDRSLLILFSSSQGDRRHYLERSGKRWSEFDPLSSVALPLPSYPTIYLCFIEGARTWSHPMLQSCHYGALRNKQSDEEGRGCEFSEER